MDDRIFEAAVSHLYVRFEGDSSGHDRFHSLRVCDIAERICLAEGGDMEVVKLAALLHDVDDRKLFGYCEGHPDAEKFMSEHDVPYGIVSRVCTIISEVSFKGTDSVVPCTLEGMIVQDADRLDAIGAIGIARAFAYGGSRHRMMFDPDVPPVEDMDSGTYLASEGTSINHFYEKLLKLKGMMNTLTAIRMAERRHRFMLDFLLEFYDEWEGN